MKKQRTLVLGDVHGSFRALRQVLEASHFDYKKDKLIFLGDVTDGYPDTFLCIEELLKVKHLVLILGNHDVWLRNWLQDETQLLKIWYKQGGRATIESYYGRPVAKKRRHLKLLQSAVPYYLDEQYRVFVHGGIKLDGTPLNEQEEDYLIWDRTLWEKRDTAINIFPYSEVYVGHTTTSRYSPTPDCFNNIWFMDQGAGYEGKLSLMDIDTKQVWQSEKCSLLYFDEFVSLFF